MDMSDVADRGLLLLGCGKMGSAMLGGWLAGGLPPGSVWVIDPAPSDWVMAQDVHVNAPLPESPAIVLVAVLTWLIRRRRWWWQATGLILIAGLQSVCAVGLLAAIRA